MPSKIDAPDFDEVITSLFKIGIIFIISGTIILFTFLFICKEESANIKYTITINNSEKLTTNELKLNNNGSISFVPDGQNKEITIKNNYIVEKETTIEKPIFLPLRTLD